MLGRLRKREGGFTLIELLIVVAIIGIIAALLIPNFLDALQKAKQKRTLADERNIGTAMMSRITDEVAAAAAAAGEQVNMSSFVNQTVTSLEDQLVPQYIQDIPSFDGWKRSYFYYLDLANPLQRSGIMAIGSCGAPEDDTACTLEGTYTTGAFTPTDYIQDIIWTDGFFVRWPQKLSTN